MKMTKVERKMDIEQLKKIYQIFKAYQQANASPEQNLSEEEKRLREMEDIEGIGCRLPTESLLREARLLNIPKRGFCVSADIEIITAESYRYLIDREEFTPPVI